MLKINLDDIAALFPDEPSLPAPPTPIATYATPTPCIACGAITETVYTNPAAPLCETCVIHACDRLDWWEHETVRYETMLRDWLARLETHRAAASLDVRVRYGTLLDKITQSVSDPALYTKLQAGIDREIANNNDMGQLLATMRRTDEACVKISHALDRCRTAQSALLHCPSAIDWTIPDDVHAARMLLYAERPATDDPALAIRTMRQEALAV